MDTSSHVPQDYGHPENDAAERSKAEAPEGIKQGDPRLETDVSEPMLTTADGSVDGSAVPLTSE